MTPTEQNVVTALVAFARHDPACALSPHFGISWNPFKWWPCGPPSCTCGLDKVFKRVDDLVSE